MGTFWLSELSGFDQEVRIWGNRAPALVGLLNGLILPGWAAWRGDCLALVTGSILGAVVNMTILEPELPSFAIITMVLEAVFWPIYASVGFGLAAMIHRIRQPS